MLSKVILHSYFDILSFQADAEERKKQFEQILHEHEEIVTAISHQTSVEGYEDEERDV